MEAKEKRRRVRLSLEVEPELHRRVKLAATRRDMTIREYVVGILEESAGDEVGGQTETLPRMSASAFARDWDSEEDRAYDGLS